MLLQSVTLRAGIRASHSKAACNVRVVWAEREAKLGGEGRFTVDLIANRSIPYHVVCNNIRLPLPSLLSLTTAIVIPAMNQAGLPVSQSSLGSISGTGTVQRPL